VTDLAANQRALIQQAEIKTLVRYRALTLAIVLVLAWPEALLGQVTFEPSDCDFRVWFVAPPTVTRTMVPVAEGRVVESTVAELNPRLDDGYAHYFRAECVPVALGSISRDDLIEAMTELARMNHLQDPKVWVEELPNGPMVVRVRASIDSGQRVYFLDIRRYLGETSMFDAWAGAERFPTNGIVMFFRSVSYRGRLLHN
jgi:hypothetical protein